MQDIRKTALPARFIFARKYFFRGSPELSLSDDKRKINSITIPIIINAASVRTNRSAVKAGPRNSISTISCGIFNAAQEPRNITIFVIPAPFRSRDAAMGNATYKGPVGNVPSRNEIAAPLSPEPLPNHFFILSFGIQISINPISMNTGGMINAISRAYSIRTSDGGSRIGAQIASPQNQRQ
ncbi:MAG: hypothetical protein U5N56_13475 [Candidatus Marinimicrobia bacterium]|nr:hypothetical protein [Candidatus Neomarinimicrobiota bacterium]